MMDETVGTTVDRDVLGTSPAEEYPARTKPSLVKPSSEEIARHETTHCPLRSWCPACAAASAKEDAHLQRSREAGEGGHPLVPLDYEFLQEKITVLVAKDEKSGAVLAYDCLAKEPGDDCVFGQFVHDLEDWGRRDVRFQTDGEPAMLALQQAVAKARKGDTVLRNSFAYNPQSNGGAKKVVQDVIDLMRRMLPGLSAKLRGRVDLTLLWAMWLVRHAAFVLTRSQVGHDGLTPWRRLICRTWNGYVFHFGEKVLGKLALKKPSTNRKVFRGKKKLGARSLPGVWLGCTRAPAST